MRPVRKADRELVAALSWHSSASRFGCLTSRLAGNSYQSGARKSTAVPADSSALTPDLRSAGQRVAMRAQLSDYTIGHHP